MPVLAGCVVLRVREARSRTISGGFGVGETPLPIPNRAVKPHSADGTWPSRAWESRSPPVLSSHEPPSRAARRRKRLGRLDGPDVELLRPLRVRDALAQLEPEPAGHRTRAVVARIDECDDLGEP